MGLFTAYALIEVTTDTPAIQKLSDEQAEAFCRAWNRKHAVSPLAPEDMREIFSCMKEHGQHWLPAVDTPGAFPDLIWLKHAHHCPDGSVFSDGTRQFVLKKIGTCRQHASDLGTAVSAWCSTETATLPQIAL